MLRCLFLWTPRRAAPPTHRRQQQPPPPPPAASRSEAAPGTAAPPASAPAGACRGAILCHSAATSGHPRRACWCDEASYASSGSRLATQRTTAGSRPSRNTRPKNRLFLNQDASFIELHLSASAWLSSTLLRSPAEPSRPWRHRTSRQVHARDGGRSVLVAHPMHEFEVPVTMQWGSGTSAATASTQSMSCTRCSGESWTSKTSGALIVGPCKLVQIGNDLRHGRPPPWSKQST